MKFPFASFTALEVALLVFISFMSAVFGVVCLWRKQDIGNVVLLLVVIVVCLGLAELWLAHRPEISHDPAFSFEKDGKHIVCFPDIEGTQLPQRIQDPKTGRYFLCVAEDRALRKRGYFSGRAETAVIVGDSFTYGGGVVETDTLGFLMGFAFPGLNFLNYGTSGVEITAIRQILSKALDENPSVKNAIYFYNINDVLLSGPVGERQKFINDLEMVRLERIDRYMSPVGRRWFSKSALFRMMNTVLVMRRETALTIQNYLASYDPKQNGAALNNTIQELIKMDQMARGKGVRLTVVIYPLLYKDGQGRYPFDKIHRFMEDVCHKHGIRFIDGQYAFSEQKSLRSLVVHPVVDYHPNGKANRLLVEFLYKIDKVKPLFK